MCATHASFNLQVIPVDKAKRKMVASRKAVHRKCRRRCRKPTPTPPGKKKTGRGTCNLCCVTVTTWQCHRQRSALHDRSESFRLKLLRGVFNFEFLSIPASNFMQPAKVSGLSWAHSLTDLISYSSHGQAHTDDGPQHVLHLGVHLVEGTAAGYHTGRIPWLPHHISTSRSGPQRYQGNLYTRQHRGGELFSCTGQR